MLTAVRTCLIQQLAVYIMFYCTNIAAAAVVAPRGRSTANGATARSTERTAQPNGTTAVGRYRTTGQAMVATERTARSKGMTAVDRATARANARTTTVLLLYH